MIMEKSKQIKDFLEVRKNDLAVRIVELQYGMQPDFWKTYGDEGKKLSIRDAGYHLPFLGEAIAENNPEIFSKYVVWVKTLFHNLKFPDDVVPKTLECTQLAIEEASPEYGQITAVFIQAGLNELNKPLQSISSYIQEDEPLADVLKAYLNALLSGDKNKAASLIMETFMKGCPVKDIYLKIFQPAQYEVGRLWMSNQISVAKEHFCSAATQMIMSQLYPYIFNNEKKGKTFIGACVGGELHEIGIRMVADFFEMEGWDTYYLGANTPASVLINAAEEYQADVLGLSVALPYHRSLLKDTISQIRQSKYARDLKIIIGGVAINEFSKNWNIFGADAYASDALGAVCEAEKMVEI